MVVSHGLPEDPDDAIAFLEEKFADELEELDDEFEDEREHLSEHEIEDLNKHHEMMKRELRVRHEAMVAWQHCKAADQERKSSRRWDIFSCCRDTIAAQIQRKKLRRAQAKLRALQLEREEGESLAARRDLALVPLEIPPKIIPKKPLPRRISASK
jgi:hypothetical protein